MEFSLNISKSDIWRLLVCSVRTYKEFWRKQIVCVKCWRDGYPRTFLYPTLSNIFLKRKKPSPGPILPVTMQARIATFFKSIYWKKNEGFISFCLGIWLVDEMMLGVTKPIQKNWSWSRVTVYCQCICNLNLLHLLIFYSNRALRQISLRNSDWPMNTLWDFFWAGIWTQVSPR